jgi:hypothetical protein
MMLQQQQQQQQQQKGLLPWKQMMAAAQHGTAPAGSLAGDAVH